MKLERPTVSPVVAIGFLLILGAATPGSTQVCGNGIVEPPEECDDGAAFRLDGCAPDCTYEHGQRMVEIELVVPTQLDIGTGGLAPDVLVADPSTGKVTVTQPEDAYSMWAEFAAERVHMTNHLGGIFTDGFESSSLEAWSTSQP